MNNLRKSSGCCWIIIAIYAHMNKIILPSHIVWGHNNNSTNQNKMKLSEISKWIKWNSIAFCTYIFSLVVIPFGKHDK